MLIQEKNFRSTKQQTRKYLGELHMRLNYLEDERMLNLLYSSAIHCEV